MGGNMRIYTIALLALLLLFVTVPAAVALDTCNDRCKGIGYTGGFCELKSTIFANQKCSQGATLEVGLNQYCSDYDTACCCLGSSTSPCTSWGEWSACSYNAATGRYQQRRCCQIPSSFGCEDRDCAGTTRCEGTVLVYPDGTRQDCTAFGQSCVETIVSYIPLVKSAQCVGEHIRCVYDLDCPETYMCEGSSGECVRMQSDCRVSGCSDWEIEQGYVCDKNSGICAPSDTCWVWLCEVSDVTGEHVCEKVRDCRCDPLVCDVLLEVCDQDTGLCKNRFEIDYWTKIGLIIVVVLIVLAFAGGFGASLGGRI